MSAASSTSGRLPASLKAHVGALRARLLDVLRAGGERGETQRDALVAFAIRVGSAGLLYLTQIALARWLGGFEYGLYVFVWTWVLILGGLTPLGMSLVMMRLVPEYRERGEPALLRGLVFGGRWLVVGTGTAIALVGLAGLSLFASAIDPHYLLPAYLALVCVPLYALSDVEDGIGRGFGWIAPALVPPYILRPLLLLASMVIAHAVGLPMTATTAAAGAIVATWAAAVIQTVLIEIRIRRVVPRGPRRTDFPAWLGVSLPLLVVVGSELVFQNTDILVISHVMTPRDVGIYFAAAKTISLILFVHFAVGSAVAHRFAGLNARGDRRALEVVVRDAVTWTFWPSLVGAAVLLALGHPLLALFGAEFEAGYPVMLILVFGILVRAAVGPVDVLLNMLGEQRLCAAVLVGATALNIALNLALVPAFGLVGAATATSLSLAAAAIAGAVAARRRLGIDTAIWRNLATR
jgi:O-antigen/teichoic acid export membrane protein